MSGSIASMTGYARAERADGPQRVRLEIRSVNGRNLDMRLRLPPGFDALDIPLRQEVSRALSRGSVNLVVTVERDSVGGSVRVNPAALETVLAAMETLSARISPSAPPALENILALPGVLVLDQPTLSEDEDGIAALVMDCVAEAIEHLCAMRVEEGRATAVILNGVLDSIEALVSDAQDHPVRAREHVEARLRAQLANLVADAGLPPDRLAQEALLLATKADIQEELDRLRAHITAARKLIADGGPVGRRLDFLAQEFNREANTLCAKANAVELTAIGLDLKAAIDQLREQVQNIE